MTGKEYLNKIRDIKKNLNLIWHPKTYSMYKTYKPHELKYKRGDL